MVHHRGTERLERLEDRHKRQNDFIVDVLVLDTGFGSFYTPTRDILRFSSLVIEAYDFTNAKRRRYGLLGLSTTLDF